MGMCGDQVEPAQLFALGDGLDCLGCVVSQVSKATFAFPRERLDHLPPPW